MSKNISILSLETLSLVLVLSYLVLDNIYLVFIGIFLALYEINKNKVDKILSYIKINRYYLYLMNLTNLLNIDKNKELEKNENSMISLVEKIEESGFIPSLDNTDDVNAA